LEDLFLTVLRRCGGRQSQTRSCLLNHYAKNWSV